MNNIEQDANASSPRYSAGELCAFATELLQKIGLASDRAEVVAEILLEGDLMGHTTHGLQLLAPYLGELEAGRMLKQGQPQTIADKGSTVIMDGCYLPGPWLVVEAMELAFERIAEHPVMTVVIRRSHHIACLSSYLKKATDKGLLCLLITSDPSVQTVAPYGGLRPLYTPNPLAAGIPTQGDPILLDISMSCTTNGLVNRLYKCGEKLPYPWLMDNEGNVSDDPATFVSEPPGTILPLGGTDLGYKGYGLGILVESLTSALAGFGRADEPKQWGASVFLQVIDPGAFGGKEQFVCETQWLAQACRSNPPRLGGPAVRLPGDSELALRAEQLKNGLQLYPAILPALEPWAEKLSVLVPKPLE